MKISVIIPTYNRPLYLKETIGSVINQTCKDWEIILVNDGGIDVMEVVRYYNDPRIKYFNRKKNRGKAACLNFAIKKSRGYYIAYIDDDDIWYSDHLETLSTALDRNPDIGVAYSDLYAVRFIKDESSGIRYPLEKAIHVARDFNRDFMFYFNHILHVSMMHRKDIAIKAGGYDENVTVLIDWNMGRKLSFSQDFKYIPKVTGEYYMPINKSDRISNLEREDNEKYKHNIRKIKADLPPEPWTKVESIGIIFPVMEWNEKTRDTITNLIDKLCYPVRYYLINNKVEMNEKECRDYLGKIGSLKNIYILTPDKALSPLDSYRFGAESVNVKYVYLLTERVKTEMELRLIKAMHYIKSKGCCGVKWDVESEKKGPFDVLVNREYFLSAISVENGTMEATVELMPENVIPITLKFDTVLKIAKDNYENGNYEFAYEMINEAVRLKDGGAGEQYLIDLYAKICFELKKYDEAEIMCNELIERGYCSDNSIRLAVIYQIKGKYDEAIRSYQKGLEEIGLKINDLDSEVFPIATRDDFWSFRALIGTGECFIEKNDIANASRYLHKAARLKANSFKPFLGFAKLFLKTGEYEKAEKALLFANGRTMKNPEVNRIFGILHEKKGEFETAFEYLIESFIEDKADPQNIEPIFRVGIKINKYDKIIEILNEYLQYRPGSVEAMEYLSLIYYNEGRYKNARHVIDQGLLFDSYNTTFKELSSRMDEIEKFNEMTV